MEKIVVKIETDLEELAPKYLVNRRDDLKALTETLKSGDFDTIRIKGHDWKGTGAGYGFQRITEIGAAIEKAAMAKDTAAIKERFDDLQDFLDRVEIEFVDE